MKALLRRVRGCVKHAAIALVLMSAIDRASAQGSAFSYQGKLSFGGQPASGNFDLRFSIYDDANGKNELAGPFTNSAVGISNGFFNVTLDFGGAVFSGPPRWLEIAARTNATGDFATLAPRQELTATPYSIFAGSASNLVGVVSNAALAGTYTGAVNFNNPANSFSGDGRGLTNISGAAVSGGAWPLAINPLAPRFGAVGDGVTDDRAALSNAIVAAGPNGRVDLQNRQYAVNGSLIIDNVGVTFGNGFLLEKARGTALWVKADRATVKDLYIGSSFGINWMQGDIGLLCATAPIGGAIINAVFDHLNITNFNQNFVANNLVNSRITQSTFSGGYEDGILIANVNEVVIQGCDSGFSGPVGYGLGFSGFGTLQSLTNCWGIRILGGLRITVENSDINGCRGMDFESCYPTLIENNMEGLFMPSNTPAITFQRCYTGTIVDTRPSPAIQGGSPDMSLFGLYNCELGTFAFINSVSADPHRYDFDILGGGPDGYTLPNFNSQMSAVIHATPGDAAPITIYPRGIPNANEQNSFTAKQAFLFNQMIAGSDIGTNTVTPGRAKLWELGTPNWAGAIDYVLTWNPFTAGAGELYLGFDPYWGTASPSKIIFGVGPNADNVAAGPAWTFDGTQGGALYPNRNTSLGLPGNQISTGWFSNLVAQTVTVSGTTNQVSFGATNNAPANTANPAYWISVQVAGQTNQFRLPLYQ